MFSWLIVFEHLTPRAYKHFLTSNSLPVSDEVALSTLLYFNTFTWFCISGPRNWLHIYTLEMCGFWLLIRFAGGFTRECFSASLRRQVSLLPESTMHEEKNDSWNP